MMMMMMMMMMKFICGSLIIDKSNLSAMQVMHIIPTPGGTDTIQ